MTKGNFAEYTWTDLINLLYKDIGLDTPEKIKEFGTHYYIGKLAEMDTSSNDVILRIYNYFEPFDRRVE